MHYAMHYVMHYAMQRHAVVHDQKTDGVTHCPLAAIAAEGESGATFEVSSK